jgi:hypothetical protein
LEQPIAALLEHLDEGSRIVAVGGRYIIDGTN